LTTNKKIMKKTILTTLLSIVAIGLAYGQGQVNFANVGPGLNAPIFQNDGTTRLAGAGYQLEILAGTSAGSLTARAATGFLTGGGAGYVNGGVLTLAGIPGGTTAFIQVRAWNTALGATYDAAVANGAAGNAYGIGNVFQVTTGNPAGQPPTTPAILVGLTSFNLNPVIPEPSTFVLAGLGIASLLLFRRRK
jgi:hypothetical protein